MVHSYGNPIRPDVAGAVLPTELIKKERKKERKKKERVVIDPSNNS